MDYKPFPNTRRICIEIHVSVSEKCGICCCCCRCRHCCDDWLNFHRQMSQLGIVVMTRQRCDALLSPIPSFQSSVPQFCSLQYQSPSPYQSQIQSPCPVIRQGQKQIVKLFVNFIVRSAAIAVYTQLISDQKSAYVRQLAIFATIFRYFICSNCGFSMGPNPFGKLYMHHKKRHRFELNKFHIFEYPVDG